MDKSYKSDIIQLIKQMETDIGNNTLYGLFNSSYSADGKKNVGCNQFRGIASDCRAAECYEEIMLFIRYTQSKADRDASWKTKCANGKPFGELVTDYMEKVKALCGENAGWDEVRETIRMFFGYLYWQSRIWADQCERPQVQEFNERQNNNRNNWQSQNRNGGTNNNQVNRRH